MLRITGIVLACLLLMSGAQGRTHHRTTPGLDPMCNITMPCEAPYASSVRKTRETRGKYIAHQMGFGAPRINRKEAMPNHRIIPKVDARPRSYAQEIGARRSEIVEHPGGCPRVAFCGCGAAVRLLGAPVRSLWLAANWFRFPRTTPAPDMAGVRPHHVIALIEHRQGNMWLVYDANSGGRATRIHEVDISRYTIVNPRS